MNINTDNLISTIASRGRTLESGADLDVLMERIGEARVVMLGEASHGTKEYYMWRTEITKKLITEKGFSFMAVEGDWPDCYEVNRYIKGHENAGRRADHVLRVFKRWPSWMWANEEVRELVEWLREHNHSLREDDRFGFYGLDVYSLWESMESIIGYLTDNDPDNLERAYKAYDCFEPYGKEAYNYAYATTFTDASCEEDVVKLLSGFKTNTSIYNDPGETLLNLELNALVTRDAEHYYRTMLKADDRSWNIRDMHMEETLERLLDYYGPESKAVVWAHNTHIGDARATPMREEGIYNIGELARDEFGRENVVLVGFGSYRGSVIAGEYWGSPMTVMIAPDAKEGSWEKAFHEAEARDRLIITDDLREEDGPMLGHRAIGVVYNPNFESGNYVPTDMANRYDAFIYLDETVALEPLPIGHFELREIPETFPVGE